MTSIESFYDAWNRRDSNAVAALFGPHGTYSDPICREALRGEAVGAHVRRFLDAFPEARFSIRSVIEGAERAAVEWTFVATCNGAIDEQLAAHGAAVRLDGIDVFELRAGAIAGVRRTFDRHALADALGLQTITEPIAEGSMTFGYSLRDWVSKAKPGALGMTWILAHDEAEKAVIRSFARRIVRHFHEVPGFIGIITGFAGLHGFTFTAWESEEALRRATHEGPHGDAMQAFGKGLSAGVFTSVWSPARLNRIWSRCPNGHANDAARAESTCRECGAALPERQPYF